MPSGVWSALCGVRTDLLAGEQGMPAGSGSVSNTSSPAPPRRPAWRACTSAAVSTTGPRAVLHEDRPGLHQPQLALADEAAALRRQPDVERHDVRRSEELVERDVADAELGGARRLGVEGPGHDVTSRAPASAGHHPADRAGAHHAERLALEIARRPRRPTGRP